MEDEVTYVRNRINDSRGFVYLSPLSGGTELALPYPSKESGLQTVVTLVNTSRTADGIVRGEKIGRDQGKVELTWAILTPDIWSEILQFFDANFYFNCRYIDMVTNEFVTRTFYVGDRSAQPFLVDKDTHRPKYYLDCKANVIDTGK